MGPRKYLKNRQNNKGLAPRVLGSSRNHFGTRVSQRVECEKCLKIDYVSIHLTAAKSKFCRICAENLLGAFEQGRSVAKQKISLQCDQCQREFEVAESLARKKTAPLCLDCYRGFFIWRGKADRKNIAPQTRQRLIKIGLRSTFRKNDDTI
jgi:hypothetical protein